MTEATLHALAVAGTYLFGVAGGLSFGIGRRIQLQEHINIIMAYADDVNKMLDQLLSDKVSAIKRPTRPKLRSIKSDEGMT